MIHTVVHIVYNVSPVVHAVSLSGSATFRGFLIIARVVNGTQRVGSFTPSGADSQTACAVSMHKCSRQPQGHREYTHTCREGGRGE